MKRLTLKEWSYLEIGPGPSQVTRAEADALLRVAESAGASLGLSQGEGERVLVDGRHRLRAQQTVGVIVTTAVTLEILPKIDTDAATVRRNLIHMIAALDDLPLSATDASLLDTQNRDILEILIARFALGLVSALRAGAARTYVSVQEELPALRGRLNVEQQFTIRAGRADRLICRHDTLSPDTPLNRILKAAAALLSRLTQVLGSRRLLEEVALHLEGVGHLPAGPLPEIYLDRSNQTFRHLYDQARMFLRARYQTTSSGRADGVAILFRMNLLFEAWFARSLRQAIAPLGWKVRPQSGKRAALWRGAEGVFHMIPDILVEGHGRCFVLDTKWKRLEPISSNPKRGVAQSDVYQMLAYQQAWGADGVALIYPGNGPTAEHDLLTIGSANIPFLLAEVRVDELSNTASGILAILTKLIVSVLVATA